MTIDWAAFGLVLVVSVVAAALVVTLFATGIRLLATPAPEAGASGTPRDEETDDAPRSRPPLATALAVALFAVAGAVVLAGVVLIVT